MGFVDVLFAPVQCSSVELAGQSIDRGVKIAGGCRRVENPTPQRYGRFRPVAVSIAV